MKSALERPSSSRWPASAPFAESWRKRIDVGIAEAATHAVRAGGCAYFFDPADVEAMGWMCPTFCTSNLRFASGVGRSTSGGVTFVTVGVLGTPEAVPW